MSGLAPLPSVRCRWQLKISSARRRYLVTFSFTASRRSLLGSTIGDEGHQGLGPPPTSAAHPSPSIADGFYFQDCFSSFCPQIHSQVSILGKADPQVRRRRKMAGGVWEPQLASYTL